MSSVRRLLILIPAFNEAAAIGHVVREVRTVLPEVDILVVDDASDDCTVAVACNAGASVLQLPHHLGLGGGVQAGYQLACELRYEYVIRIDGDGQHDPRDIQTVLEALQREHCEMVIGSRFLGGQRFDGYSLRNLGILFFRALLRPILGKPVRDPTSGFVGVNRHALELFSRSFPLEYPEIEALVVLQRRRFRFVEVPCSMRPRFAGRSTITTGTAFYYMAHVLLGVFVNILKFDGRRR